jgi:hypothetical protein
MKKRGKKKGRPKLKKNGEKNIDQSVKERESTSAIVRAREETFNCIAKKSEIKRALISHQPLIVLMYKEALLCTNDLVGALPSDIVSLLQEFEDVLPEEGLNMLIKELDILIIHMGMELNLHKTLCHFLVAQLQDLEPNVSRKH